MAHVGIIGGGGTVGATIAYSLFTDHPDMTITLVDTATDVAKGHAIDLESAHSHASHPVGQQTMSGVDGGDVHVCADVSGLPDEQLDVLVMAASAPRPEGTDSRGSREALLSRNTALATEIGDALSDSVDPVPVVVVTNPLDRVVYQLWQATSDAWKRHLFVGYSLSETARAGRAIANRLDVPVSMVSCPVMGEHGEGMVPVFSRATVRGDEVSFDADARVSLREEIRDVAYDVIQLRGIHETSRWVSGFGVSLLVRSLLSGGPAMPVCLSTPLAGEYGYRDVAVSVPVSLTTSGIGDIHEWELSDEEQSQLDDAVDSVQSDLQ